MRLTHLCIRRMPGFERQGFDLEDLSDGLNLIVGPNASGKTTSCRAIRGLLWPKTLEGFAPVSLVGHWQENGESVHVELEGSRHVCQIDGQPSDPPAVPDKHLAECFTITADTLFQAGTIDNELADKVQLEMAGGYDLGAAIKQFSLKSRHGRTECNARKEASQLVNSIQQEQQSLQREEAELVNLEQRVAESRQAQAQLNLLNDVRHLLDAREQIAHTQECLEAFSSGLDKFNGDEIKTLELLQADLANELKTHEEAKLNANEARNDKDATSLPQEGIAQELLREQNTRLEGLRDTEQQVDQIRGKITKAQSLVGQTLSRLGGQAEADKLDGIELAGLDSIEKWHQNSQRLEAKKAAIEERLAALGEEQPHGATETLTTAIHILRQWFEASSGFPVITRREKLAVPLLATMLLITGIVIGIWLNDWTLAWIAGFLGAWLLFVMVARATRVKRTTFQQNSIQQRYERLDVEPPEKWNTESAGKRLNQLEQRLAEARRLEQLQSERTSRQAELNQLQPDLEGIDLRRKSLAEQLGVDLSKSELSLVVFAHELLTYRQAKDELLGLQERLDQAETDRLKRLAAVNGYLAPFDEDECTEYEFARVRSENVAERAQRHRNADAQLRSAEKQMTIAQNRIGELSNRKRSFFENLGLAEEDESELKKRFSCLAEYDDLQSKLSTFHTQEAVALGRLADVPVLKGLSRAEVDIEALRLQGLRDRLDGLVDQVAGIRTRVEQTRSESKLQDALARLNQATDKLAESREDAILTSAGAFLLSLVQEEQQAEHQPAVFQQAHKLLNEFTRGRYDLLIDRNNENRTTFRAFDNTQQRGLKLEELSGGTRMQLLLAVRLAFAASVECGVQLPIVLDEALNGTDPTRFRAIVECMVTLIGEGRQVFYLTCQPGDADAWQQVTKELGYQGEKRIDLSQIRRLQQPAATLQMASAVALEPVPTPNGRSMDDYVSSLDILPFDPANGAAGLHLAFLLDDPIHLHGLLSVGIKFYGQLKALLEYGRARAYLPDDAVKKASARATVVQAICEALSVGRGRPISREILAEAGIRQAFIDPVTDIARDLRWDAKSTIEALKSRRVRRLQSKVIEAVEEALTTKNYLDPNPPLTNQESLLRVLSAANDVVEAGCITKEEVRELFERFWSMASEDAI